jgi:hypothetical protein
MIQNLLTFSQEFILLSVKMTKHVQQRLTLWATSCFNATAWSSATAVARSFNTATRTSGFDSATWIACVLYAATWIASVFNAATWIASWSGAAASCIATSTFHAQKTVKKTASKALAAKASTEHQRTYKNVPFH